MKRSTLAKYLKTIIIWFYPDCGLLKKITYRIDPDENSLKYLCFHSSDEKGVWCISYQRNFVFVLSNNKEIKISTPDNKACGQNTDTPFIKRTD